MTKQEIQALIDSKIAGQGTAVDLGGALPTILHEILEAAFAGENVQSNWNENNSESPQFIQNKPTIPAPYSLPVASAETLGGVKVGSGLSITPNGVLSCLQQYCIVYLDNENTDNHTADIRSDSPTSSVDLRTALSNGVPVVAFSFEGDSKTATWTCYGWNLSEPGAIAVFSNINRAGLLRYVNVDI